MTVVLGIATALGWGAADFFGGSSARRAPVFVVVAVSQLIGLLVLAPVLLLRGVGPPDDPRLFLACVAGLGVTLELRLIYLAIGRGQASLTAPTGALGATFAVMAGVVGGDRLTTIIAVGMLCSVSGGALTAWASSDRGRDGRRSGTLATAGLCLGAALGVGLMLTSFHAAGGVDPYWATACVSLSTCLSASLGALITRRCWRTRTLPGRSELQGLTAVAATGVGGDLAYAAASRAGALSVLAALSSLYPLATVGLAVALGHTRPTPRQAAGVAVALLGAVLLGVAAH